MKQVLVLLLLSFLSFNLIAQKETEFWFVVPETTESHSTNDSYGVLRFVGYNEDATVTISMPANSGFTDVVIELPKGEVRTYSLDKTVFENILPDEVDNKGVLIKSTTAISGYFEIAGALNPDKFTLKGDNALGQEFYIPSQNDLYNHSYDPMARERIDIVATENNTQISILVTDTVIGHSVGDSYSVTLDKGQTYSIVSGDESRNGTLAGTHITSSANIAITISDDSVQDIEEPDLSETGGWTNVGWDLIGDQIVPVNIIGKQYIMVRSTLEKNNTIEKAYIIGTEDNTSITFNGDGSWVETLNEGEMVSVTIPNGDDALLIVGDKPVYVYRITVCNGEAGSALLPAIGCSGSTEIAFNRNFVGSEDDYYIQLLVKDDYYRDFIVYDFNGDVVDVDFNFFSVRGTGLNTSVEDRYRAAVIDLSDVIGNMGAYRIVNSTGLFHMGILDFNGASLNYGYFSDFNSVRVNSSMSEKVCAGETHELTANSGMNSYNWYLQADSNTILSTSSTLTVENAGDYVVEAVNSYGCESSSEIEVEYYSTPDIGFSSSNITVPEGSTLELQGEDMSSVDSCSWFINSGIVVNNNYSNVLVAEEGQYKVEIVDFNGCTMLDSTQVTFDVSTIVNLINNDDSGLKVTISSGNKQLHANLYLNAASDVKVSLFELTGKKVSTDYFKSLLKGDHELQLNSNALYEGIYILEVEFMDLGTIVRKKIILF